MGVDPAIGLSIAKMESGFVHEKRSAYGAVGVFQLMPSTAKKLGYNPYYLNDNCQYALTFTGFSDIITVHRNELFKNQGVRLCLI